MSASAPDAHAHTAAFSSRAAAVFGALSAGTGQPAWSLSRETVFKAGKAADYSSDEEVQAAVAEKWREETLPSDLLDLAGEGREAAVKPSAAFCNALDNEDEFDETDAIAAGRRGGDAEPMPNLATEVPDDNAYERRSQAQAATAAPDAMDVELAPAPRAAAPAVAAPSAAEPAARLASLGSAAQRAEEGAREQAAGEDEEERARGKLRKRVRFAADAAPQPAEDESSSGAASMAPWSQRPPGRRPQRGGRGSYVPDHVRNPGKYTCYALDEPLTVGGGGGGGAEAGDVEQVQAARAAQTAAAAVRGGGAGAALSGGGEEAARADLPAFGGGIEFRSRAARAQPGGGGGGGSGDAGGLRADRLGRRRRRRRRRRHGAGG